MRRRALRIVSRALRRAACLAVLLLAARHASALAELAVLDTPGAAKDVELAGSLAYVADGAGGLRVIDVSDPLAPAEIGALAPLTGNVAGVAVVGSIAYLAEGLGGLSVVDVSNPATPLRIASLGGIGLMNDVAASGGYAFLTPASAGGIQVVDVSNPATPTLVATAAGGIGRILLQGGIAYTDFDVVDVSNPLAPQLTGGASALRAVGSGFGVSPVPVVFDLADPAAPEILNGSLLPSTAPSYTGAALTGSLAWLTGPSGFALFDVSDREATHPEVASASVQAGANARQLEVQGTLAYLAADGVGDGLFVLDVADPMAISVSSRTRDDFSDLDVVGTLAYATVYVAPDAGLRIFDVSVPTAPVLLANLPLARANTVRVEGSRAYVLESLAPPVSTQTLHVIDVSNPAAPAPLGSYVGPEPAVHGMEVSGSRVFLATANGAAGALVILDATNPTAIFEAGRLATAGPARGLAVDGLRAWVASDQVDAVDASFPSAPQRLVSFDHPDLSFGRVERSGNRLHVAASAGQIATLDLSDPLLPRMVGLVELAPGTRGLGTPAITPFRVAGTTLYLGGSTLRLFDVAGSSGIGPRGLGTWSAAAGERIALDPARDLAFVAGGSAGLRIVDVAAERAAHECANGRDDDGDGLADFAADPGCNDARDASERFDCLDGLDNDADGATDHPADAGCASASEAREGPDCSDGLDNDGDGLVDFAADPGCRSALSASESPQCQNGLDDDGDGGRDFDGGAAANGGVPLAPADPDCAGDATRPSETPPPACGLGFELALLLPLLRGRRRR